MADSCIFFMSCLSWCSCILPYHQITIVPMDLDILTNVTATVMCSGAHNSGYLVIIVHLWYGHCWYRSEWSMKSKCNEFSIVWGLGSRLMEDIFFLYVIWTINILIWCPHAHINYLLIICYQMVHSMINEFSTEVGVGKEAIKRLW